MIEGVIHSNGKLQSTLIFDEDEFSIQRRVADFVVMLIYVVIAALAISFICLHFNTALMLSVFGVIVVAAFVFVFIVLKLRRNNRDVYSYKHLANLSVSEFKRYVYVLRFSFDNGTTDSLCVNKSTGLKKFLAIAGSKGVSLNFSTETNPIGNDGSPNISGVLESKQAFSAEIYYDNDAICVTYKLLQNFIQIVFISALVISNLILVFTRGIKSNFDLFFAILFILAAVYLVFYSAAYFKHREQNHKVYDYSQIRNVKLNKTRLGGKLLSINFVDGHKAQFRLSSESKYGRFLDLLKTKNVEVTSCC